jgi:predicted nucleic acid-binding protein
VKICVDTVVLIDVLKDEFPSNQERLYSALAANETLIAPSVVFAELMPQFSGRKKQLNSFLKDHNIRIDPLEVESVSIAGSRWMKYLNRKSKATCPNCGEVLDKKEHFLSDFYIGGFALANCDAILTRDRGIYRKYFPELKNYKPDPDKPELKIED